VFNNLREIDAIALFFQAFVAHGWLTAIGPEHVFYGHRRSFSRLSCLEASKEGFSPMVLSKDGRLCRSIMTYLATALQLALSLNPDNVMYSQGLKEKNGGKMRI
jgi:ABC-type Co2+ transport system permease subunit